MKKIRMGLGVLLGIAVSLGAYSSVQAIEAKTDVSVNHSVTIKGNDGGKKDVSASSNVDIKESSNESGENGNGDENNTSTSTKESETADDHRSAISAFVHSLLNVADREGGIGSQVRVIAQDQDDSASTTADAMEHVDGRDSVATFFIGSDFKNLNRIRNESEKTSTRINELRVLSSKVTNTTDKTELDAQIKILENEQANLKQFVSVHENTFSLFGWLVRLFNK